MRISLYRFVIFKILYSIHESLLYELIVLSIFSFIYLCLQGKSMIFSSML